MDKGADDEAAESGIGLGTYWDNGLLFCGS